MHVSRQLYFEEVKSNMEPIIVFSTIIKKFVGKPLQIISFNFTDPAFKITALTLIAEVYSVLYTVFSVTTCIETDISQCTQSLVMGAIGAQCAVKAFFATINHVGLRKNIKLITHLYESNKTSGANKDDLRKAVRINHSLAKLFAVSFLGTMIILDVSPIPVYVFTGQLIPAQAVKMPFVTTDTVFGYIFHLVFHCYGAFNAGVGVGAFDIFMITTTIHIWPMTRILERAVSDLNRATQSIRGDSVKNSVWLKLQMRNITLMHRETYFYVRAALDMSYPLITAELYTDQTVLILLLYCVLKLKWLPGILIFVSIFLKLLAFCSIGTAVDYLNDKTYEALANIDCTMLPDQEKKNVLIMLHAAQHPPTMHAGLVPINLKLFVEVLKTIYSVGMLLLKAL